MKIITKNEVEEMIKDDNQVIKLIVDNFKYSIKPIYKNAWLENCNDQIIKFLDGTKKSEKQGLYIYGECGTGKTHSAYSIYRNFKLNKINCRIENTVELLRLFKKDFSDKYENNFETFLYYDGVLIIDDIGAERNSEFVDETLYHLINTRYEKLLPTFFTSNLSPKELAEKNGDRLVSRIIGMCNVVKLEGKDRRI